MCKWEKLLSLPFYIGMGNAVNFPLINPKKFGPLDNHRTVERRGTDNRLMQ